MKMKRDIWEAEHFCHNCNAKMAKTKVMIQGMPVRAWECKKCKWTGKDVKETELNEEEFMKYLDDKGEKI